MKTITLRADGLAATFVPEAGMVGCSLVHRGDELLAQRRGLAVYAETGKTMGIPLLHPWANRLADWSYEALGRRVDLRALEGFVPPDGETGLPIHGTVPGPWEVVEAGDARLAAERRPAEDERFRAAFPFPHRIRLEIDLDGATLRVRTTVEALGEPVPVAFGFHPYLTLPGVPRAAYRVELPVRRRLVLDARKIPTGETEAVEPFAGELGDRVFDDGYDRLDDGPVFAVEGGGRRLELRFKENFGFAQVFAPAEQDLVCFEPMTAPADALRTGAFALATDGAPYSAAFSITVQAA